VVAVAAYLGWKWLQPAKLPAGFACSNGRIEATEIDVATKLAGRIVDELVDEGDWGSSSNHVKIYSKPPPKGPVRVIFHPKTATKGCQAELLREILAHNLY
jgi:hypothetical protein